MAARSPFCSLILALSLAAAHASAQQIIPPRALSAPAPPYPDGASGDHEVILRLDIGAAGQVDAVAVLEGQEPFAAAAAAAARAFRFAPATRDGRPVASRVRFQVKFTRPVVLTPPPLSGGTGEGSGGVLTPPPLSGNTGEGSRRRQDSRSDPRPGSAPLSGPGSAPLSGPGSAPLSGISGEGLGVRTTGSDITITGVRAPPGAKTLSRSEVRQLPGAFGDPFRAIEALPGVTPLVSGAPFFYVRGAPPGNVGYFLDGVRVPYLFHLFLGPSVVHPGLVQQVDLYAGGYPARFGRFAGGIVAGETAPPVRETHGEASLRLIDAGALVEAPFDGGRGVALVGGRYAYTALLFSLLSPSVVLDYSDYQARVSYRVSRSGTVTVFGFGARDFLGEKTSVGGTKTFFDTQFHRLDLRHDEDLGGGGATRLALTLGLDRTGSEGGEVLLDRLVGVRSQTTLPFRGAVVRFGADVQLLSHGRQEGEPDPQDGGDDRSLLAARREFSSGAYAEVEWAPLAGVTISPGLRVDAYGAQTAGQGAVREPGEPPVRLGVDPRLSARFEASRSVRLVHAFGVAHQPPSFVVPLPGFQPSPLRGGLQESWQSSAGVEADLPGSLTGTATVFQNLFFRLSDALGTRPVGAGGPDDLQARSQGSSQGLELHLRRPLGRRLGGYLSYTLSRSRRSVGRASFPSNFDRTHVASGALGYELGRGYRVGGRLVAYSGAPRFEPIPGALLPSSPPRLPAFYRLDVRVEKRWRLGEAGRLSAVIEVLNTTLSKEYFGVDRCDNERCEPEAIGPIFVPSAGVEAFF